MTRQRGVGLAVALLTCLAATRPVPTWGLLRPPPRAVCSVRNRRGRGPWARRDRVQAVDEDDEPVDLDAIPPFVIAAEAKAAPARGPRIVALVGVSVVALVCAVAHGAEVWGGQDQLIPSLVNNPTLSCAAEALIFVGGAVLARADIENREENQLRIWEALKKRKAEMDAGGSRANRRKKGRKAKKAQQIAEMATAAPPTDQAAPAPTPAPGPEPEPAPAPAPVEGGGLLEAIVGQAQKAFPEANALARANAESLNSVLEDAGVLAPVAGGEPSGDADDKVVPAAAAGAEVTSAVADAPAASLAADSVPSKSKGKGTKKGKGKKKKNGKKARK